MVTFSVSPSGPTFLSTTTNLGNNTGSPTLSSSSVTNAATAFNWFGTSGTGGQAVANITNSTNKALAQFTLQQAKASLLPLVKAEYFATQFNNVQTLISSSVTSINSTLTSILNPSFLSQINTLTPSYTSSIALITSSLNTLKTAETRIFTTTDSIDITAAAIATNIAATTTLTVFTGTKTYVSPYLDPAILGAATIPALTSVNGNVGNANTIKTIYTNAATALAASNVLSTLRGEYLTATKQIFDVYAMIIAGYADASSNSGTTGNPIGLRAGLDYEVSTIGQYQTSPAPSATPTFWNGDHAHTW